MSRQKIDPLNCTLREEKTSSDTFVCQTSPSVNCSDVEDELIQPRNTSEVHEEPEVCLPNFVSLCQTKPEIVTVTEQRQMCGVPKVRPKELQLQIPLGLLKKFKLSRK